MEWREPVARGTERWDVLVGELSARPGEWAVVASASTHDGLSHTRVMLARRGCEVVTRQNGDGEVEAFARWPGAEG